MRSSGVLILFALLTIPLSIRAQSSDEMDAAFAELFDVSIEDLLNVGIVTASKKKQSVADAPATAYVVRKEDIEKRGYFNLIELLEDVPEVEIQRNSNPEFKNQVTIRGVAGNEKFLVLLNGIRITPPTGDGYSMGTNFSLANVERVEVIIGPASALYGVDAFSGIVNIITPGYDKKDEKGAKVSMSGGAYATSDNSFVINTKLDKMRISIAGNYYYSQEADLYNKYPQSYNWYNNQFFPNSRVVESPFYNDIFNSKDFERWAGSSFHGDEIDRKFNIPTASYFLSAEAHFKSFDVGIVRHDESHSTSLGVDPKYTSYDGLAQMSMVNNTIYASHNYESFNTKWSLKTTMRMSHYTVDPKSHFANSASRWQRGYVHASGQSAKFQEQVTYSFNRKTDVIAGVSFENLSALPRTGLSTQPYDPNQPADLQTLYYVGAAGYESYLDDDETVAFNDSLVVEQKVYQLSYQNIGSFVQFQFKPLKKLTVTAGTRYDYNSRYGSTVNPRVGLVWAGKDKKFRAKLLYGEAFLAPSPKKSFEQSGGFYGYNSESGVFQADFFRVANPDLKPEKLRSLEGSINIVANKNIAFAGNGFYTRIEDLIDLFGQADPSQAPDNVSVFQLETSVNQGRSEIFGGTFKGDYVGRFGDVKVSAYGAYSYIDGSIINGPLLFTAKHTIKAGAGFDYKRFSIFPRVIFRSKSNSSIKDSQLGTFYTNSSFAVVNLHARYVVRDRKKMNITAFLKVTNLLDARYYHVFVGNEEGMTGGTPQDPVRFMLGLNLAVK